MDDIPELSYSPIVVTVYLIWVWNPIFFMDLLSPLHFTPAWYICISGGEMQICPHRNPPSTNWSIRITIQMYSKDSLCSFQGLLFVLIVVALCTVGLFPLASHVR